MIENNNEVVLDRQEYETLKEGNENQFQLRWLVMPDFIYSSDLSFTEAKIFSFLWTYKSDKFYFSNEQLARMFNVSEKSISVSVNNLKNEGYINLHYEIKSGGGQIRFISISNKYNKVRLEENDNLDWKKTSITTGRKLPDFLKDNKINDNKINNNNPPTPLTEKQGGDVNLDNKPKFILPDWIKPEVWSAFEEMRKKLKHPLTEYAKILTIKKLENLRREGNEPNEVLEQSIQRGWQGVFALYNGLYDKDNKKKPANALPNDPEWDKQLEDYLNKKI